MNPALWGGVCALSWGSADFAARFSGRAIGHDSALFGMLLTGAALLTLWVWLSGAPLVWQASHLWLLGLGGVGAMVATLLLYQGLARGPVTIVAPIVGSYPAVVVAFWVLFGARPSLVQWLAMAATMAGVIVVARSARRFEDPGVVSLADLRRTVAVALGSSLAFAVTLIAGQLAVPIFGELQTTWVCRVVSLVCLSALFLWRGRAPRATRRWAPVMALQGVLDTGGYLAVFAGSHGAGAAMATVTASTFGVVTVLLARVFLREAMSAMQWAGIALVFAGVAVLSYVS